MIRIDITVTGNLIILVTIPEQQGANCSISVLMITVITKHFKTIVIVLIIVLKYFIMYYYAIIHKFLINLLIKVCMVLEKNHYEAI